MAVDEYVPDGGAEGEGSEPLEPFQKAESPRDPALCGRTYRSGRSGYRCVYCDGFPLPCKKRVRCESSEGGWVNFRACYTDPQMDFQDRLERAQGTVCVTEYRIHLAKVERGLSHRGLLQASPSDVESGSPLQASPAGERLRRKMARVRKSFTKTPMTAPTPNSS